MGNGLAGGLLSLTSGRVVEKFEEGDLCGW